MVEAQVSDEHSKVDGPSLTVPDTFVGALEAIEEYFDRDWTDGLPVVPVTQERLDRMLAVVDRDPDEELGEVPPRMGVATVRQVAYQLGLGRLQAGLLSGGSRCYRSRPREIVQSERRSGDHQPLCAPRRRKGPLGAQLGFNSGYNCFGQGTRANATVGRALRLVLSNVGGGRPGTGQVDSWATGEVHLLRRRVSS